MKVQNKIFNFSIAALLVTTLFLPQFVSAEDVVEPAPVEIAPEAPAPAPEPVLEIPTPEIPTPEAPVVETPAEENVIVETPLADIPEPEALPLEIPTAEVPVIETPAEENVIVETQSEELVAHETPTIETPSEQSTTLEAPVSNSVRLTIRLNDSIIYSATTTISSETVQVTDNAGGTANIAQNTVLGMITNADANSESFTVTDLAFFASFNSYIINCISTGTTPSCYNWQYTVNDVYPFVGIDDYVLNSGDDVYLYFGTQNRFSVADNTISLTEPISVTAEKYEYRTNTWAARANVTVGATQPNPADPWTPTVVTSTLTNTLGQATLYVTATGTYNVGIGDDYYYPTKAVTVTLPQTTINLDLETTDGIFFKQNVTITACPESPGSVIYTLNAWCALEQTATANNWTLAGNWFGSDVYLDSVNTYTTDFGAGKFWSWYSDLQLGETGLNKHLLTTNENLLLTYGVNPIKLEVSSTTPTVGTTTTISISELNFAAWPAEWVSLSSTTLHLNDTTVDLSTGAYEFIPTVTTTIFVTKTGYVSSDSITIIPGTVASTNSNTTNTGGTGGSSSTNENNTASVTFDVTAAGNFLLTKQNSDGSIGSASLYSDWAAIAIGSLGNSSAKAGLITYLKTNPTAGTTATDYERRAMALLALGLNPYTDTPTNYIAEIMKKYDGTQFGDAGLVNDDIFALFPLLKSGYSSSDVEIQKAVTFILSKQNTAGGWESPDLTAAAVQALAQVKSLDGVNDSLSRAKNYLKLSTKTDGRIGDNTFSTGWGLQALSALGESATTWNGSNPSPLNYLATQQQTDGGMNPLTDSTDNRIWATSYAIPAAQGKTWDSILISVPKITTLNSIGGNTDTTATSTTQTVTSTQQTVTPTTQFVTTSPEIIIPVEIELPVIEPTLVITETATETPAPDNSQTNTNNPTPVRTIQTDSSNNEPEETKTIANSTLSSTGEQLSAPSPETPASGPNKALFGGAAALAGTAGAYLAWRFLQGLV